MPESFEAHITINNQYMPDLAGLLEHTLSLGWKFSSIDGDPILGPGSKCYLTAHDSDSLVLKRRIDQVVDFLKYHNIPWLRLKIEHIIYDTATNTDRLSG